MRAEWPIAQLELVRGPGLAEADAQFGTLPRGASESAAALMLAGASSARGAVRRSGGVLLLSGQHHPESLIGVDQPARGRIPRMAMCPQSL